MTPPFIVFSDLDGCLLDRRTFSAEAARPAVDALAEAGIPLVFCTSQTRAEVEHHRRILDNDDPFVVENGGAIFIPRGYFPFPHALTRTEGGYAVVELGVRYERLVRLFQDIRRTTGLDLRGFSDMGHSRALEDAAPGSVAEHGRHTPLTQAANDVGVGLDHHVGNLEAIERLADGAAHPPEPAEHDVAGGRRGLRPGDGRRSGPRAQPEAEPPEPSGAHAHEERIEEDAEEGSGQDRAVDRVVHVPRVARHLHQHERELADLGQPDAHKERRGQGLSEEPYHRGADDCLAPHDQHHKAHQQGHVAQDRAQVDERAHRHEEQGAERIP